MKDMLIGTLTGIVAAVAMALLMPRPRPVSLPVRELSSIDNQRFNDLGRDYLTMTTADPVYRKLQEHISRVNMKQLPFEKFISYLAEVTGQNFYVDWREIESTGLGAQSTITLNLQNVSAAVVLKTALDNLGGDKVRLGYCIIDGVIHVSTGDDLNRYTVTRIYNVRDLLEEQIAWHAKTPGQQLNPNQAEESLIRIIQETIDPTTWADAGGAIGFIRGFGGRLIVTQTGENQHALLQLLAGLRRSKEP